MKTIGHHTCKSEGGNAFIEANAPFKSLKKAKYVPFLGDGYYYWDNNIGIAKKWGKSHYNNEYCVVASTLNLNSDMFFDLVGNRYHMIELLDLAKQLKLKNTKSQNWTLGVFIEFLKN